MATVEWSDRVARELDDIADYIEMFDARAARDVAERLIALGESLVAFPHRGRPEPDGTRVLVTVWPYILRYHVSEGHVTIVGIRHGRRRPLA